MGSQAPLEAKVLERFLTIYPHFLPREGCLRAFWEAKPAKMLDLLD